MKEEKRCWIRTRYLVKRTGSICAKIVNGEGEEYTTCLHRNGSHSCDCKAGERGVLCYHVKHLRAREAERPEQHVEKAAVSAQTGKDSQRQEQEAATPITERIAKKSGSAKTEKAYRDTLFDFRAHLKRAGLDLDGDPDIIAPLAQGYAGYSEARGQVSASTHNQRLSILSSFYKHAKKRRVVTDNPIDFTDRRKAKTEDAARPIDVQTIKLAFSRIDRSTPEGKRDYAILAMLLETGRRISEVASLTYRDIQREGRIATVIFKRCKGNKQMIDRLPAPVASAVFDYLAAVYGDQQPAKHAPVWLSFSNKCRGRAISARTIERVCEKYLGTSKAHATRHTWAVEMKKRGADITHIQKGLGHSNLQVTTTYLEDLIAYENPYAAALADVYGIN